MKIAFYDAKPYDKNWFTKLADEFGYEIIFLEARLSQHTAVLAQGCEAVCLFVNDIVDKNSAAKLCEYGVKTVLLRCAGYDNVDLESAKGKLNVLRVPSYSPPAVAEFAVALLLAVNRNVHRAYQRTRDFNFSINGLMGLTLNGKTAGVVGTGKIGKAIINILNGLGMKVIAYDPYPDKNLDVNYVTLDELFAQSHVISLHCPLSEDTRHIINKESIMKMRDGVILVNTSRGALVDTGALIEELKKNKFTAVGLDVYEEEDEYFFEDRSNEIINDDDLARLATFPNVLVTSHQAFFTSEALMAIAEVTMNNLRAVEKGLDMPNALVKIEN